MGLVRLLSALTLGRLMLQVGGEQEFAGPCLCSGSGTGLSIDRPHVQRLASRKEADQIAPSRCTGSDDAAEAGAQHTGEARGDLREAKKRHAAGEGSWTAIATAIAATDLASAEQGRRLSAATVRRIITEMRRREREYFRSNRKSRMSP